jgi:chromosome segregation ATPase
VYRADGLEYGRDGVIELRSRLEDEERDADGTKEGVARLRDQYNAKRQKLEECEGVLSRLEAPTQDLRIKHADHNNRLYDFIDVTPGDAELKCFPAEFWTALRRCYEAYTRCRDFELDMHEAEQEQRDSFRKSNLEC